MNKDHWGESIRELRRMTNMSQIKMAVAAGISYQSLRNYEKMESVPDSYKARDFARWVYEKTEECEDVYRALTG